MSDTAAEPTLDNRITVPSSTVKDEPVTPTVEATERASSPTSASVETKLESNAMDLDLPTANDQQTVDSQTALSVKSRQSTTMRIHLDTRGLKRPIIFNYQKLYKQELRRQMEQQVDHATPQTDKDAFYAQMLQRANLDKGDDSEEEKADTYAGARDVLWDVDADAMEALSRSFFAIRGPLPKPDSRNNNNSNNNKDSQLSTVSKRKAATKGKVSSASVTSNKKGALSESANIASKAKKSTAATSSVRKAVNTSEEHAKKKKKPDIKNAKVPKQSSSSSTDEKKAGGNKNKSKTNALEPLDPEIEALMEKLRQDVKQESFENKAKFPTALKPTVLKAGLLMLRKDKKIDENLVKHLMNILPYNKFTLRKFLTTKAGQMRVDELQQEIDEMVIKLKQSIDLLMPEQQRLYEEQVAQAQAAKATATAPVGEAEGPDSAKGVSKTDEIPAPKFKCSEEVRKILYDIMQAEETSVQLSNEITKTKDTNAKADALASETKSRKQMYQRLLSCWPEGWMTTYEMSRHYSNYKIKVSLSDKKQAASSATTSAGGGASTASTSATVGSAQDSTIKKRKRPASTTIPVTSSPSVAEAVESGSPQKKIMTESPSANNITSLEPQSSSQEQTAAATTTSTPVSVLINQPPSSVSQPTDYDLPQQPSRATTVKVPALDSDKEVDMNSQASQKQQQQPDQQQTQVYTPSNSMSIQSLVNAQQTTQNGEQS